MNQNNHMARSKTEEINKNHHTPDTPDSAKIEMNSKKENSLIRVLTNLCQKKKKEVNIVPIPDKCGYGAVFKEDIDIRFLRRPFFLYKVVFEKGHFAFYSYENSWSFTKEPTIRSLVVLIKRVEGVRV